MATMTGNCSNVATDDAGVSVLEMSGVTPEPPGPGPVFVTLPEACMVTIACARLDEQIKVDYTGSSSPYTAKKVYAKP